MPQMIELVDHLLPFSRVQDYFLRVVRILVVVVVKRLLGALIKGIYNVAYAKCV